MWAALAKPVVLSALVVTGVVAAGRFDRLSDRALPAQQAPALDPYAGADEPRDFPKLEDRPAGPMRNFYFTRAAYRGGYGGGWKSWSTDYPKADRQFLVVLKRLTNLDVYDIEHPVRLTDPALRRYPFIYAVEVGYMSLNSREVQRLREYLLRGGFMVVDDFWGSYEWRNFELQMRRVFPEYQIVDLPMDHPIFHTFYDVEEIVQVPNVGQGVAGGPTSEQDGYEPKVRGIIDEKGRLMVVINWNTDLGDAWEWAENAQYPLKFSTYAYQMGVNFIVYAMSH